MNYTNIILVFLNLFIPQVLFAESPKSIILQSLSNVEEFTTTEGNTIELIKSNTGCLIKAIFFGETGKAIEIYEFKNQQFIRGIRYSFEYSYGGLTNLEDNKGKFDTYLKETQIFDIKDIETLKDFKTMKSFFPNQYLNQCL